MRLTWLGHASCAIESGAIEAGEADGSSLLIDPLGRKRCTNHTHHSNILITHSHVDHLNRWTLKGLDKNATVVVPFGAKGLVADLGFARVIETKPGKIHHLGPFNILCVPTKHDSGRWRKAPTPECCGYLIEKDGVVVHHGGDIDMSNFDIFDQIGKESKITASLLPIGGMLPVWYYRNRRHALDKGVHIDPDSALDIAFRLRCQSFIPIHWGTLHLPYFTRRSPAKRLLKISKESKNGELVKFLEHQKTWIVQPNK